ncbi:MULTISPECIES: Mu transposase C-terminal domain-containing protein [Staphylococcus]|uniref:Transposase n=3 Tax=Staphylococcus TaxID=1279 RepID=A0A7G3T0K9_9STAP|nr:MULTISPECIES: Mu transposase C-terminal domain-containing protein [Staphylococcus]QJR98748.1 transposase [Staphylococcus arlettae]QJR98755.1 Transposase [Staphylococcus equorum]AKJ75145.1 transposase [Staphylococcus epidermidis]MDO6366924.1 Mu transposase C-terminal domain-containing protein [Staphylococcus epidermidis]MDO6380749.1 Mu transposase C-terminal domain-containing protein [Staphylococcus epidermidis]
MNKELPSLTSYSDQKRHDAMTKYEVIKPYILEQKSLQSISKEQSISIRTLQSWAGKYKRYGLKGLVRKKRADSGEVKVNEEVKESIKHLILSKPRSSITSVYRQVCQFCAHNKIAKPSYSQVYSLVKSMSPALKKMAYEGTKVYQDSYDIVYRREASQPNEIWQADHTLLDIYVYDEKNTLERPWLTIIMDDYSRAIAGYFLSFNAPSANHTSLAFHQAIWQKKREDWEVCGIPQKFYTDHGSDFTSRHIEQVAIDLKINIIFSAVGVPRGRGKIERFFSTTNQLLLQDLPGYIGNKSTIDNLTLQSLEDKIDDFIVSVYHNRNHGTTGMAPIVRWGQSGFLPNMPESLEDLDLLLLHVAKARKVHSDGIRFQGFRYIDTNLAAYVGETVIIRYDPKDLAEIRVFHEDKYLCTAVAPEISNYVVSLKDIVSARNKRRNELKNEQKYSHTIVDNIVAAKQDEDIETEHKTNSKKSKLKRYRND